jgi:hypothetical protein
MLEMGACPYFRNIENGTAWLVPKSPVLFVTPSMIAPEELKNPDSPRHLGSAALTAKKVRKWMNDLAFPVDSCLSWAV